MTVTTTSQDIHDFAVNGFKSLQEDKKAALDAATLARENERNYEKELRTRLMGMLVEVSGHTETVQVMIQDGYEHRRASRPLKGTRLVINGVFITPEPLGGESSPIVHASHVDENNQPLWRSELSFRLLRVKLHIVSPK